MSPHSTVAASVLPSLKVRGRAVLPIVQGGMGVGISAHRLAGSVARLGGVGTISSVDLRRHHPDLMSETAHCRDRAQIDRVNLIALDREIQAAKTIADGHGSGRERDARGFRLCRLCAAGVRERLDAVVVGAGLPLDLPELTADFPDVALIPILSDARGISLVVKKWARKNRLPDAIVIEHPRYAGGHLGAAVEDLAIARFDFELVSRRGIFSAPLGLDGDAIPLIPAGGINSPERVRELLALGASAVQLGTPFAVTEEGDAAPEFKAVLANARPEDIVEFMSVAGLPARAVRTPWLDNYLRYLPKMQAVAHKKPRCTLHFDCLIQCGLRDGIAHIGQFCIDTQLAAALRATSGRGCSFAARRRCHSVPRSVPSGT